MHRPTIGRDQASMAALLLGRQASTLKFCMAVLYLDRHAEDNFLLRLVQADTTEGLSLDLYLNKQTGDQYIK